MSICCPIITQLTYNLASIILFLQHSIITPRLFPLQMRRSLFSRTYSLKLEAIQVRGTTEKNEGYRRKVGQLLIWDEHLGRSIEKSNSSYTGTGFPLYGHYGRGKWTRKRLTKGWRALGLRNVSPISWAHSCRWVPWLICQRHDQTCQSTRISSIVTSQTRWLVRSQCARPKALIT